MRYLEVLFLKVLICIFERLFSYFLECASMNLYLSPKSCKHLLIFSENSSSSCQFSIANRAGVVLWKTERLFMLMFTAEATVSSSEDYSVKVSWWKIQHLTDILNIMSIFGRSFPQFSTKVCKEGFWKILSVAFFVVPNSSTSISVRDDSKQLKWMN